MPALNFSSRMSLAAKALMGLFSDDSLREAHGLLTGVMPSDAGAPPYRGASSILKAYSTMPWLRAVSQRIATAVATSSTQWRLYAPASGSSRNLGIIQRSGDGATRRNLLRKAVNDVVPIDDHLFLQALNRANSLMVGESLFKLTQIHLDLIGESFWIKQRNNFGAPVEFWPIPPDWVQSTPTPSSRAYRVAFRGWQGEIPDTEMLWMADLDPANPYGRGSGLARSLSDELETDEYAAKHTRQLFFNRARPDMIIWPKQQGAHDIGLQQDQVRRLEERWLDGHQGFWRAAKPFFVGREINVHEVNQSLQELQMVELRQHERDTIVQVFGVPPELLGILTNSNRSTIDSADYLFSRWVVTPRMEFLRAQLQERLLPEYDDRLILDFESPIQEDREHMLESAKAAPWALTVNEWRGLQGQEPLPANGGDVHMMPLSLIPVPTPRVPPAPIAGISDVATDEAEVEMESIQALLVKRRAAMKQEDVHGGTEQDEDLPSLWKELARQEGSMVRVTRRLLNSLHDRAPDDEMYLMRSVEDFERIVQFEEWLGDVEEAYRKPWMKAFMTGAESAAAEVDLTIERRASAKQDVTPAVNVIGFNVVNPLAVTWMDEFGAEQVRMIGVTTKEGIKSAIGTALDQGFPPNTAAPLIEDELLTLHSLKENIGMTARQHGEYSRLKTKLVQEIADNAPGATKTNMVTKLDTFRAQRIAMRATVIARTELAYAASAGQDMLWNAAAKKGLLDTNRLKRVWLSAGFGACKQCLSLAANKPVPFGKTFIDNKGKTFVTAPAHPNCRCAVSVKGKEVA
jgi:HK97 family phage portal protein